jgi:hypothetical protein
MSEGSYYALYIRVGDRVERNDMDKTGYAPALYRASVRGSVVDLNHYNGPRSAAISARVVWDDGFTCVIPIHLLEKLNVLDQIVEAIDE